MRISKGGDTQRDVSRSYPDLTHKYGEIGISAVAAAARYHTEPRDDERTRVYLDHED